MTHHPTPPPLPEPIHVLLVDDLEDNLVALEALLRRDGLVLITARSGTEALEHCLVHDFALALLDVQMPEMDGVQLAELMRGARRTREVPIIFVTANYDAPQRVFQGYDAGAVDFLVKPIEPRILRQKVDTFLELFDSKRRLSAQLVQVEQLSAQLAEALRVHETFVAAVGHDLRSPLSAISIGLEMLTEDLTTSPHREMVRRLTSATRRMTGIIEQLNDLARLRLGGGLELSRSPGSLDELVRPVLDERKTSKQPVAIELETRGDLRGEWDLARVARVAANLVGNAVEHGDRAQPIRVELDGTAPAEVILRVCNAGVVPPALLPELFEPFRQGGASRRGMGLGLYIVRAIAEAHGGKATLTSSEEAGTCAEVRLPRRAST
ncbi:MAG: hybrid sensor histidine kinase/response regulator [Kofleriaceae bacterium]